MAETMLVPPFNPFFCPLPCESNHEEEEEEEKGARKTKIDRESMVAYRTIGTREGRGRRKEEKTRWTRRKEERVVVRNKGRAVRAQPLTSLSGPRAGGLDFTSQRCRILQRAPTRTAAKRIRKKKKGERCSSVQGRAEGGGKEEGDGGGGCGR